MAKTSTAAKTPARKSTAAGKTAAKPIAVAPRKARPTRPELRERKAVAGKATASPQAAKKPATAGNGIRNRKASA
jgi:hypothetical protein